MASLLWFALRTFLLVKSFPSSSSEFLNTETLYFLYFTCSAHDMYSHYTIYFYSYFTEPPSFKALLANSIAGAFVRSIAALVRTIQSFSATNTFSVTTKNSWSRCVPPRLRPIVVLVGISAQCRVASVLSKSWTSNAKPFCLNDSWPKRLQW